MDTKTELIENNVMNESVTDIVLGDHIVEKMNSYLSHESLNIGRNDHCYVRVVRNHLEFGRAKIVLVE
jgi:hypothetical protein